MIERHHVIERDTVSPQPLRRFTAPPATHPCPTVPPSPASEPSRGMSRADYDRIITDGTARDAAPQWQSVRPIPGASRARPRSRPRRPRQTSHRRAAAVPASLVTIAGTGYACGALGSLWPLAITAGGTGAVVIVVLAAHYIPRLAHAIAGDQ